MLALVVVPVISVAVKQFGRYLRELSHTTQAAAAVAASIAEVSNLFFLVAYSAYQCFFFQFIMTGSIFSM